MTDPKLNIRISADLTAIRGALGQLSKDVTTLGATMAKTGAQGQKSLSNIEKAASGTARAVRSVVTSFAALAAVKTVVGFGDQFAQLNGVLRIATNTTEEFLAAQKGVFDIAQRTRAPVRETANTYGVLERTTKNLGLSQGELLRTLETVNKAIGSTPVSAQAAQASLVQFGQALGGDFKAGAQELNSILEQTPGLAIAIAQGLGVQTSELKKLGEEGKLSAELVVRGLLRISDQVDENFAKVPATVSGALQQIKNELLFTLGTVDLTPLLGALDDFRKVITDPTVVQGLSAIAAGIVRVATVATSAIPAVTNFARFLGESFAAAVNGPAGDDLVRLDQRITKLKDRLAELTKVQGQPLASLFIIPEINKIRAELVTLEAAYASAQRNAEEAASAGQRKAAADLKSAAAAKEKAQADFDAAVAAREAKAADEAAAKETERRQKQIRDAIADLEEQAATYNKTTEETIRYQFALLGANAAQTESALVAARRIDQLKAEEEAQKDATKATEERKKAEADLAVSLAGIRAQLAEADGNSMAVITERLTRERDEMLRKIAEVNPGDQESISIVNRLFDVELARARAADIEQQATELLQRLRQKEDNIALQVGAGIISQSDGETQLQQIRGRTIEQLEELRLALLEIYQTSKDAAATKAAAEALEELDIEILRVKESTQTIGKDIKNIGQGALENFFTKLATGAATAKDAIRALVVEFIQGLARMAAEALAKRAILAIGNLFSAGAGGAATVAHGGGRAGHGMKRMMTPALAAMMAIAPRFHSGGVAGLNPGEVPAVLKQGERVLSPSETAAYGKPSAEARGTRVVNVFDPSFVPDQMDSAAGEKVIMNVIAKNPGRVRQLIG